ncbi:SMC family ATPase [Planococcus liqunii]|uniref:AAA family ATPase n=1 Tax=Planococcus liqunii TaxID=3058394 RepID=UPI002612DA00|nr:SMC family ATPase [Planococcus sp. N056]WKA51393.1 SMC family ATPase [Planococcus sp. N056]
MRPLKLKLTAFGPYKHTETIDFADLKGNQLFVISGSTGSGKTTIFDGICFALYGAASGSDRVETRHLRSDFAEDGTHTCVEMEFEIHNKVYRILRQMSHVKAGNKSATGERYEFFEKTKDGEVPCVERQIVSEINRRVEEIIGLTQNQFSQIVMLPQGEFRKLLTSETDNKEEILRKIFKTEPYKMIAERLKQKRDAAKEAYQGEQHGLASHVGNIKGALPERDSALFELLQREHYNVHQIVAGLESEAAFYQEKMQQDEQYYLSLYKKHDEKMNAFHEAKKWNDRFSDLADKVQRLEQVEQQLPAIAQKEQRLKDAERAGFIEGIENIYKELEKEKAEKLLLLEKALKAEQATKENLAKAESAFETEQKRGTEREKISQQVVELRKLLPAVEELDGKKAQLTKLQTAAAQAGKELEEIAEQWQTEKDACQLVAEKIEALDRKLEAFDEQQAKLLGLNEQYRVLADLCALQKKVRQQQKTSEEKESVYQQAADEYRGLEAVWFANQAQVLASALHDGDACPVCGSSNHPNKAVEAHQPSVSKEELDRLKARLDGVDSQYRNAAAALNALAEQLERQKEEAFKLGLNPAEADADYRKTEEQKAALEQKVAELQADRKNLRVLKEQLNVQTAKAGQLEKDKTELAEHVQQAASAYGTAKAVFEQGLLAIPEEVRVLSVLEEKISEAEAEKRKLERLWESIQQELQRAKEQFTAASVSAKHAATTAEEIAQKKENAQQQWSDALQKSDFSSEQAYQEAKLKEQERIALKEAIQAFRQNRHTLMERVQELKAELSGRNPSDIGLLEAELSQLKAEYEAALNTWNRSQDFQNSSEAIKNRIIAASEKAMQAEQQLNRIADLHDMIRGQNGLKISFERYLQIEYLEQIIQSANERLKNLSNGQFYLMRSDRQEARGKQSGLGLDVYDAYTGQTRDVKTLSGGEKFNASLCLALGMADVIQSFQGNVAIDTMFIDEGFGSLDDESLNKSIDTLIDLQKSGRMIGVISHVQELKAAIPAILEVKKSKEGFSQTKFVIK